VCINIYAVEPSPPDFVAINAPVEDHDAAAAVDEALEEGLGSHLWSFDGMN